MLREPDFLGKFLFKHVWGKGTKNGPQNEGSSYFIHKYCLSIFLKIVENERLYYPVFFSNPISAKILVLELLRKILLSVIVSDCRILSSAMAQKRIELCFVCSSVFMETRNLYLINWVLWFLPCFTVCLSFGLSDCSFLETTH